MLGSSVHESVTSEVSRQMLMRQTLHSELLGFRLPAPLLIGGQGSAHGLAD